MKRALFLDRDGVLDALVQHDNGEWGAPLRPEQLSILPGAAEALRRAADQGWLLVVISNQPDAAKGKTTREALDETHRELLRRIDDSPDMTFYYCFHSREERCACRKPGLSFVKDAAAVYDIDLANSWFVGDSDTDIECGRNAGCRTALIEYEHSKNRRGTQEADLVCADLADFMRQIDASTSRDS